MEENRIQLEQFEDRIIFMSMYNDIDWGKHEKRNLYFEVFGSCGVRKKPKDIGHSSEKCGTERTLTSQMVRGTMFSRGAETVASNDKLVDACQNERSHFHDSRKQVIAFARTCFVLIVGVDDRMGTKIHSEVVGVLCLRTHIEACGGHAKKPSLSRHVFVLTNVI